MEKRTAKRNKVSMPDKQRETLLGILKIRFEKNMDRHKGMEWIDVQKRLRAKAEKLRSLNDMEKTGGEPDIVGFDKKSREFIFMDTSAESPVGRRNTCYDREGQAEREKHGIHPAGNVLDMAEAMGIGLLDEKRYRELQKLGNFDTKSQSWLETPPAIRKLGGAIFADRRYGNVFVYHNSAPSFYAARGFRGELRV